MAGKLSDTLRILFLDREEPRRPQFSSSAARTTSPDSILSPPKKHTATAPARPIQPVVTRSPSNASSKSSATSFTNSNSSSSRQNSVSSAATSISTILWQPPPTFAQHMAALTYTYGYDLPCEFFFLGCNLRFDPGDVEAWISHSASHFVNAPLPSTTICTFCDEATFQSDGDAVTNWRERMLHIFDHLAAFTPSEYMRPDFWVIEHMEKNGLISPEDHAHAMQGTERPYCDHMYPPDYETPEMLNQKERDAQEPYDVGKEDRQRKKDAKKGKSTHTLSQKSKRSYNPHVKTGGTVKG